ncbi:CUE domain-containing protein 2-B-like [Actinia tenebrosa]|uniref:CUE domain-containing protein 2-B-like n=1 Tax=Actinia tenebrosa TaxID=6105 RepID=A0A6P8IRM7_ACTTE|nr:CUE domain-containing protein 2-B-like [Actinia tenebrosa]
MDEMVKKEFEIFLSSKLPQQTLDVLDEIVLQYLTSVLEMLDQDDSFNVEEFILMMDAYIPGFCNIPSECVFSWMIGLSDNLRIARENVQENFEPKSKVNDESSPSHHKEVKKTKAEASSSNNVNIIRDDSERQTTPYINQEQDEKMKEDNSRFNSTVQILCELFPSAMFLEVRRCLTVANGDADEAARLMLISRDSSESPDDDHHLFADSNPKPHQASAKRLNLCESEQEEIKSKLISRYSFVEVTDDQRVHRPILPKKEEKKLVRYRDNQVVSTKGERFMLEKKRETEEEKKTYVNLKPARKYRFH